MHHSLMQVVILAITISSVRDLYCEHPKCELQTVSGSCKRRIDI